MVNNQVRICLRAVEISIEDRLIKRKHPLRISRGISGETLNLFVKVSEGDVEGIGELAPVGYGVLQSAETCRASIEASSATLSDCAPSEVARVETICREAGMLSAAIAAINMACWDWLGRKAGLPLYRLFGLSKRMQPTSVTIGILPCEEVPDRVRSLLDETGGKIIKQKLGSADGIEADKERYLAARSAAPADVPIRVDANGGWDLDGAIEMCRWLAGQGCAYVEQPLHFEDKSSMPRLYESRSLPIYYDETVSTAKDAAEVISYCDGVNVKLLKAGGISEAMRIVSVCRANGKSTMIGCFSESSVAISAGAAIGSLFDHIDLDSHLNQDPDPAVGLEMNNGCLVPSESPGLGVTLR